jgi:NAD dependent epimerase/dehydratase family enzyme
MALPFKLFVGGRVGSGRQYVSWIHHDDLTDLLLFALDTPAVAGR